MPQKKLGKSITESFEHQNDYCRNVTHPRRSFKIYLEEILKMFGKRLSGYNKRLRGLRYKIKK